MDNNPLIFQKLKELTATDGYWEALSFICLRDTFIHTSKNSLDHQDFYQNFDGSRLSQTEISTLFGLTCQNKTLIKKLTQEELVLLVLKTYELWHLLHQELMHKSPIREAIFYSGNGAYKHQYRDLARIRYLNDSDWIKMNKGFTLDDVINVFNAIEQIILTKVNGDKQNNSLLSLFSFTIDDIEKRTMLQTNIIQSILGAFTASALDEGMANFNTIDDFNHRNAFPIIKLCDQYLVFQSYSLWESLYESPFFWFNSDDQYKSIASDNRGAYTENFIADRLKLVFGATNVFTNINIYSGKDIAGEIDVLVLHGSYALVIQAKSKKLTINARKGNIAALTDDFKKAIHNAYDQAWDCSQLLLDEKITLKDSNGSIIQLTNRIRKIIPMCVISDYYPALSFQTSLFLKPKKTDIILSPHVVDVFLIDLLTEFLDNPLFALDYLIKRSEYAEKLVANHELVILSTYLAQNLYFDGNPSLVMLDEDLSVNIEMAMLARRDSMQGLSKIPDGMLTLYNKSYLGMILEDIKESNEYSLQQLGFLLLSIHSDTIKQLNEFIGQLILKFKQDGKNHDATIHVGQTGLTIHCNDENHLIARENLLKHCQMRKYICRVNSWAGVCLDPYTGRFKFVVYLEHPWEYSVEIEKESQYIQKNEHRVNLNKNKTSFNRPYRSSKKTKRNQLCYCGSLKKYKHCCYINES